MDGQTLKDYRVNAQAEFLIIGGEKNRQNVSGYDRSGLGLHYDITTLQTPRSEHTASVLQVSGSTCKVLIFGGEGNNMTVLSDCEYLERGTGIERSSRVELFVNPDGARAEHAVVQLYHPDLKTYLVAGGYDSRGYPSHSTVLVEWPIVPSAQLSWRHGPDMRFPRGALSLVSWWFSGNAYAFAVGGWSGDDFLSSVEVFDWTRDRWRTGISMPGGPRSHMGAVLDARTGSIVVAGGRNEDGGLRRVEVFDMRSGLWWDGPNMLRTRRNLNLVSDGRYVWAFGGFDDEDTQYPATPWTVERWDMQMNRWEMFDDDMPHPCVSSAVVLVPGMQDPSMQEKGPFDNKHLDQKLSLPEFEFIDPQGELRIFSKTPPAPVNASNFAAKGARIRPPHEKWIPGHWQPRKSQNTGNREEGISRVLDHMFPDPEL